MNGSLNELPFGLRQLAANPGFAVAAILTLALGIGANTAVFSVLNGYLFKPLPYPHSAQLAEVNIKLPKVKAEAFPLSLPLYQVIDRSTDAFSATAYYDDDDFNLNTGGQAQRVRGVISSASLFHVLGVQPLLGRTFAAENTHPGSDQVVVISYGLWRASFGASQDAIGQSIKIDGDVYRVIGVMPRNFAFPDREAVLWMPPKITPAEFSPRSFFHLDWNVLGRLNSGVSLTAAQAQIQQVVSAWIHDTIPAGGQKQLEKMGFSTDAQSYRQVLLGDRPTTLWLLQAAVLLILLITCVNVANLLLSRILNRSHEIAMRSTLGATRAVLARQLLGEALCLTVPGGLAGIGLCWLALHFLVGSSLGAGSGIFNAAIDWRVGLFALGVVLVTAVLVSLLPIRHLAKTDLQLVLQEGGRTASGGRRTRRIRNALVITELTLATGLLAMAGLVLHSFMNLEAVDPGFRKDHVLMASLLVPEKDHPGDAALAGLYKDVVKRVNELPGVQQAGMGRLLPLSGHLNQKTFRIRGRESADSKTPTAMINNVSPGYFNALGIPVLRGRSFDALDAGDMTAIVDAGLVKKYFRDASPIGRQIVVGGGKEYTIIGVVPSVKYAKLSQTVDSVSIYPNAVDAPRREMQLVIHSALPPIALMKPVRQLIASIDPDVAVYDVHTMHEHLADSLRDKQTTMTLLLAFGGIALALAIVGVYAVMTHAVGQRRAECGVRLALGALPEDLSRLVLKDGFKLLAIGLPVGLALAVLMGYLLSSQLFGVAPFDPATLIGSAVVLCAITLVACWLPARRAAKIDPAIAMMEQ
ncbi:MAG TPA: ABC transporter permease [Gammaproteobacteria bacterium]|nr:ABC transporter permease [Gammaproteobacteria bacterium]